MTNKASTDIMNDILESLIDSTDGYEKAAEIAGRATFKTFFTRRAASRRTMASNVRDEITKLGGTPDEDGTILASAHRVFMNISSALKDSDDAAIEAVDTGEDHLRSKFERALERDDLPVSCKTMLRNYQGELRADGRLIDHLEDTTG